MLRFPQTLVERDKQEDTTLNIYCNCGSLFQNDLNLQTQYSSWYEPRHDKTNTMSVRPAKTRVSLGIRPVWSESSLCTQWVAKDPRFLHADSEDSDKTGRMPRLIWVFARRTATLLVLSCRGSYNRNLVNTWAGPWENVSCHTRTTKAQISLRIRAVWSAPLLFAA